MGRQSCVFETGWIWGLTAEEDGSSCPLHRQRRRRHRAAFPYVVFVLWHFLGLLVLRNL